METSLPATFNHPDWVSAISAQLPGAHVVNAGGLSMSLMRRSWPVAHAESFITPLTSHGGPAALGTLNESSAKLFLKDVGAPLVLRDLRCDDPITKALLASGQFKILRSWKRAGIELTGSFEGWLMQNFDHKRRKELKRLKARLSEQGALSLETLAPGGDLGPYLDGFLRLEEAGWKGRRGTAIAGDRRLVQALRVALGRLHAQGKVRFWQFILDGRPIATLYAIVDGNECTLGKIAYDENWSRFSPGVLLILAATEALFAEPGLKRADANAIPNHPMIDRIWRDRLDCCDMVVASDSVAAWRFEAVCGWHTARHSIRTLIKSIFISLSGRKVS